MSDEPSAARVTVGLGGKPGRKIPAVAGVFFRNEPLTEESTVWVVTPDDGVMLTGRLGVITDWAAAILTELVMMQVRAAEAQGAPGENGGRSEQE